MKITDVTVTLFEWESKTATNVMHIDRKPGDKHDQGLVTISTDQGIQGHAFLGKAIDPASSDAAGLIRMLKPVLMGKNPLHREALYAALWRRHPLSTIRAVGALDVALWDLAGKAANLPLYQLLGASRDKIQAYASSDHLPSPQAYAEEAMSFKERNWPAYKLHPPSQWQKDIKACEAVRKAVGDDYLLMLDSTWIYNFEEAVKVGLAIQEMGYYWYEDPLGANDIYNYQKLKEKLTIPIMATERPAHGFDSYATWVTSKATDFLRGDVALKGGITSLVKTAHLAEAFGMNYEVHTGGNSMNNLAQIHVACAIRNTTFHEVLLPAQVQIYGLLNEPEVDKDGYIHPPSGPGILPMTDSAGGAAMETAGAMDESKSAASAPRANRTIICELPERYRCEVTDR